MTDQKPPLTMGNGIRAGSDANLPTTKESSTGDLSHGDVLRAELFKKRNMSLTPQEVEFLEELIVHGTEVELTDVAHDETLCDDKDLFFDDIRDVVSFSNSLTDNASDHENSHPATSEEDGVFRRPEESKVFRKPPTKKGRSASAGTSRVSRHQKGTLAKPKRPILRRLESERILTLAKPKRPILRRWESMGSLKSVSFVEYDAEDGDHPTRLPRIPARRVMQKGDVSTDTEVPALETDIDDEDEAQLKRPEPIRSDSVPYIPSLHHPHPIRSDSVASIHSVHHAHRIHSESSLVNAENEVLSFTSIPSLHHGHHLRDEPSLTSIPSLHHGHHLGDDASLTTFGSTPERESREPRPQDLHRAQLLRHLSKGPQRPVLLRRASRNDYNGEGVEVEELPAEIDAIEIVSIDKARKYRSMLSLGGTTIASMLSTGSLDQAVNQDSIFRDDRQISLSDEEQSTFFLGSTSPLSSPSSCRSVDTLHLEEGDDGPSWDMLD